ncbi:hypothetical protein TNCV_2839241 [Trichonephila clavipes]|nr:hypothetical protein TNCV_2839241 [Trichonephila clavipes]
MAASSSSVILTPLAHADNQGEGHLKDAPLQSFLECLFVLRVHGKIKFLIQFRIVRAQVSSGVKITCGVWYNSYTEPL